MYEWYAISQKRTVASRKEPNSDCALPLDGRAPNLFSPISPSHFFCLTCRPSHAGQSLSTSPDAARRIGCSLTGRQQRSVERGDLGRFVVVIVVPRDRGSGHDHRSCGAREVRFRHDTYPSALCIGIRPLGTLDSPDLAASKIPNGLNRLKNASTLDDLAVNSTITEFSATSTNLPPNWSVKVLIAFKWRFLAIRASDWESAWPWCPPCCCRPL